MYLYVYTVLLYNLTTSEIVTHTVEAHNASLASTYATSYAINNNLRLLKVKGKPVILRGNIYTTLTACNI
jgi:hypothetical protein